MVGIYTTPSPWALRYIILISTVQHIRNQKLVLVSCVVALVTVLSSVCCNGEAQIQRHLTSGLFREDDWSSPVIWRMTVTWERSES